MNSTPFIHLIQSPVSKYFYDVNKNEIIAIGDNLYGYFKQLLNHEADEAPDDEVQKDIEYLKSLGYLSTYRVQNIEHPSTRYIETILGRKIHKITLQLTQNCNFRCKYCIYSENNNQKQRSHSAREMSFDTARKAIDFLCDHAVDSEAVNIGFYGGEPLLEFDLIKKIVAYADESLAGKSHSFAITTNGSLLTGEIVEFLCSHDVNTTISIDGPKEINDKNRVFANGTGTYDTVISRIHQLSLKYPEFAKKIQISMVIDPQNDFDCINSVKYDLKDLDVFKLNPAIVDDTYALEKVKLSPDYTGKERYHEFLTFLSEFGLINKKEISPITYQGAVLVKNKLQNMSSYARLPDSAAPGGPCIPGQMRLFVTVDGELYPCERVSEVSEAMNIGSLDDGFNFDKVKSLLNVAQLTKDQCSNCWAFLHCTACAKLADDGNQLSAERKKRHCNSIRASVHDNMRKMILLKEIPALYNQYL